MKKTVLTLLCSILVILFVFGLVLGSFDFTCSKRIGKTNYYLMKNVANIVGLYYEYPDRDLDVGVLDACVSDVYWNEQYIVVTSCNTQSDSIEGYYIVKMLPPVKKGVPWEKTGPLSKEEYEQKKLELDLNENEMKHKSF